MRFRRLSDRAATDQGGTDSGVVLVAALCLLVLLSVVAGGMIELVRAERRVSRHITAQAETRGVADAGINRGIAALLERGQRERWPVDGTPRSVSYAGYRIDISIQDEVGKIDLNTGADDLLRGLLRSAGLREMESDIHVDRIVDWRDPDDLRRLNGAERSDYEAQGLSYVPRNAAFESVDELGQVLGVSAALVERVRPALTIYSRRATVDMATAPPHVLQAIPGMDDGEVRKILAERSASGPSASASAAVAFTAAISDLTGRVFTLTARAYGHHDVVVTRVAVVRFTGDANRPYWIHEWQ